jgi:hypothetical protein
MNDPNPETPLPDSIWVEAWPDEVIERRGHDPRSCYVEMFWLGILGPSTTWFVRRLAAELEATPGGFELQTAAVATEMGLGGRGGRNSVFARSIDRACQFGLARRDGDHQLFARRMVPSLAQHNVTKLPERLRRLHAEWSATPDDSHTGRAKRLALTMFELGDSFDEVERHLHQCGIHPAAAYDGAIWAKGRHTSALAAATELQTQ